MTNDQKPQPPKLLPAATPSTSQAPVYAIFLVAGIVIGSLLTWGWSGIRGTPSSTASSTAISASVADAKSTSIVPVTATTSTNSFIVSDQKAGSRVTIIKADVSQPTWIAVYSEQSGRPNRVLGAQLFFSPVSNGSISLLRPTQKGQTYLVGESIDNGKHTFSTTLDKQVRNSDGTVLWVSFKAL